MEMISRLVDWWWAWVWLVLCWRLLSCLRGINRLRYCQKGAEGGFLITVRTEYVRLAAAGAAGMNRRDDALLATKTDATRLRLA